MWSPTKGEDSRHVRSLKGVRHTWSAAGPWRHRAPQVQQAEANSEWKQLLLKSNRKRGLRVEEEKRFYLVNIFQRFDTRLELGPLVLAMLRRVLFAVTTCVLGGESSEYLFRFASSTY